MPQAEFVELDGVALRGRQRGEGATAQEASLDEAGPFLRGARMVWRPTLRVRAMPRWETRSCKARRICSSLSGVMARLLGRGVKVLPQARQRRRAVPERFVPYLIMLSLSQ